MSFTLSSGKCFVSKRRKIEASGDYPAKEAITLSDGENQLELQTSPGAFPVTDGPALLAFEGQLVVQSGMSKAGRPFYIMSLQNVKVGPAKPGLTSAPAGS